MQNKTFTMNLLNFLFYAKFSVLLLSLGLRKWKPWWLDFDR